MAGASDSIWFKILLVFLAGLLTFGTTFWYNSLYNVPDVKISSISGVSQISQNPSLWSLPVVVENEGRQSATNIRLTFDTFGAIQNYTYGSSSENVTLVRAIPSELVFTMQRIAPGASANFTIVANTTNPTFHLWVTADQGSSKTVYFATKPASSTSFQSPAETILYAIEVISVAVTVVQVIWVAYSKRDKITTWFRKNSKSPLCNKPAG